MLPALVTALGEGVLDNLARTARLLAADTAALDDLAAAALATPPPPSDGAAVDRPPLRDGGGLSVVALAGLPGAVRSRVLHAWARELGAPPGALSHRHVDALDALVTAWRGQGATALPGGVRVGRRGGRLLPVG
ncbi:TilS substrate-binding domain-containing protein [Micromonospora sp. CA-248260]|uniref:TilS substrate-binding domain-containing protein n=1 Tax=Micromonospora sp. CA-248260 TaxID=3239962 RepID=UPI003D8BF45F